MNFISTQIKKVVVFAVLIGGLCSLLEVVDAAPADAKTVSLTRPRAFSDVKERLELAFQSVSRDLNEVRQRVRCDKASSRYYATSIGLFNRRLGALAVELVAMGSEGDPLDVDGLARIGDFERRLQNLSHDIAALWFDVNGFVVSSGAAFDDDVVFLGTVY